MATIGIVGVVVILVALTQLWPRSQWPEELVAGSASGFNVLLITLDTTRADRLGCYGYAGAETPVLDALAAGGIRFEDAVTVVPVTLPSHATILTGLDPPNHGLRHNGEYRLKPDSETLAELLRGQGYDTAAFVSAFVLDARFGLDRGFDRYDDEIGVPASSPAGVFARPIYERSASVVTDRAISWVTGRTRERPFFCWVHYFDPHAQHAPPPPFARRFRQRPYDGEIAFMDMHIGRLLDTLETQNIVKNTLVMVVADHGEGLGDHDENTHAKLIYESTMRVPLIISCPGLFQGPHVVDEVVVSIADILPTVLALLGIEDTHARDGSSLLTAHTNRERLIYMETFAPYLDNGWSPLFGLRRHHDKYILAPTPEYYDLRSDPTEMRNIHDTVSGAGLAARTLLSETLSSRLADAPSFQAVAASPKALDPDTRHRLETLGYAGTIAEVDQNDGQLPDPKEMMPVLHALDRANGLATAGRHDQALAIIKKVVARTPRDPTVLLTLGKLYIHMDRVPEAEQTLRRANAIRPTATVSIFLAQIGLADGRLSEAAGLLDQAEALEPLHGGIYLARGDLFALQRRPDEAIAAYEHAERVDPYRASAEARARIARIHEILRMVQPP